MSKKDYYEILGVDKSSDISEIKKSYRKLALKYHPDRNPGDKQSEEKFKEAAEAYETLSNKEKRQQYDQFGHSGYQNMHNGGGGGHHGMNMDDIFNNFGDVFGSMFGGSQQKRQSGLAPQRGHELYKEVTLTLKEAYLGTKKDISYYHFFACEPCKNQGVKNKKDVVTCQKCQGAGQIRYQQGFFAYAQECGSCQGQGFEIKNPCTDCKGQSRKQEYENFTVTIPKGIYNGAELRIAGKGDAGVYGGPAGDLFLRIKVTPSKQFQRDDNDLICTIMLTYPQLVFGSQVDIENIDGTKETIKIPKGCTVGEKIIIPGKGFSKIRGNGTGNLIVITQCHIPKKLNDLSKELLRNYSEIIGTDPKDKEGFISSFFKKFLG